MRTLTFVGAALGVVLSASASNAQVFANTIENSGNERAAAYWQYAGAGNRFLVEVRSNDSLDAKAIAAAMSSPSQSVPATFVTEASAATRPDYRFVLVSGVSSSYDAKNACEAKSSVSSGGSDVVAAFCFKNELISDVRAIGGAEALASGASSAAAQRILNNVAEYLIPSGHSDSTS